MLMDGRPVFNVTCYDHINLFSVLIDITLLPLSHSPSHRTVNSDLKWQRATMLHKAAISLALKNPSLSTFPYFISTS